jgi:DNA-binding PadR family transcriptional regulator
MVVKYADMEMSPTRLLVLGVVRIFQPVHGYFVRRELLSWHAEDWAHLNPGSIYNALRSLAREGLLEEVGTEAHGARPARTSYRLTDAGETEFQALLREGLWEVAPNEPANLLAAWSFTWALRRSEVIEALEHRREEIAAGCAGARATLEALPRQSEIPAHVAEHVRLTIARMNGEEAWIEELLPRLRAGEYWFDGEPNRPWSSPEPGGGAHAVDQTPAERAISRAAAGER